MDLPARISTLQRTDRWIGAPICAILTLLRRIFESAAPPGPRQVQCILFVKFAEQGSTVLAYPAIRRATEMVGRENVYFVVFEDNRFILDAMEIIPEGNVITIATRSLFGLAASALRAVLRVRKIGIDAVVDMEFLTRFSAMLTFTTGAKSRVGFHTFFGDGPYRGDLMTHRLLYNPHLHTSQMFEAMVEAQDFGPRNPKLLKLMPCSSAKILASVLRHLSCSTRTRATCCRCGGGHPCVMSNLRGSCSNVTRICLSGLPARRPRPLPITGLQMRSVQAASSGSPEKRLCGKCLSFTRAVRFW